MSLLEQIHMQIFCVYMYIIYKMPHSTNQIIGIIQIIGNVCLEPLPLKNFIFMAISLNHLRDLE